MPHRESPTGSSRPRRLPLAIWLAALLWGVTAALIAVPTARSAFEDNRVFDWGALIALIGALLVVALTAAGKLTGPVTRRLPSILAVASAPALVLVIGSGGIRSPGVALLGLLVTGVTARRGHRAGLSASSLALLALLVADALLGRELRIEDVLQAAIVLAAVGVGPIWYARLVTRDVAADRQRFERLRGYIETRRPTPRGTQAVASDLQRDAKRVREEAIGMIHLDIIGRYLRDVHDLLGADEVIYWRLQRETDAILACAWSTADASAPLHFPDDVGVPLVQWAAQQRLVLTNEGAGSDIFMVVAPVEENGTLHGALSIAFVHNSSPGGAESKALARRCATHLGTLVTLLDERRASTRRSNDVRAILDAVSRIQDSLEPASLGRAVCNTALAVTSASRAAFVTWDGSTGTGHVQSVSSGHPLPEGLQVAEDSLVARACRHDQPFILEDAQRTLVRSTLVAVGEATRAIGSLAVIPLRRDHAVVGAILIEGEAPGQIVGQEVANVQLLASVVTLAMRNAQAYSKQSDLARLQSELARKDPLTGLANRRTFDERLTVELASCDRYNRSLSLVLADLDHFKRVNDDHGHEAGDNVLRHAARVLSGALRSDVDLCARFGGEEIAILLPETDLHGARDVAERLRKALESQPAPHQGQGIRVTASFGVAAYPAGVARRDEIFPAADRALYQAKAEGRNCVRVASRSTNWTAS